MVFRLTSRMDPLFSGGACQTCRSGSSRLEHINSLLIVIALSCLPPSAKSPAPAKFPRPPAQTSGHDPSDTPSGYDDITTPLRIVPANSRQDVSCEDVGIGQLQVTTNDQSGQAHAAAAIYLATTALCSSLCAHWRSRSPSAEVHCSYEALGCHDAERAEQSPASKRSAATTTMTTTTTPAATAHMS